MIQPGQTGKLIVSRTGTRSAFLDGGDLGEVMLADLGTYKVGDQVEAFVFVDSDGALMATTQVPKVVAGGVACLEVVALTNSGAFLDWGLRSDLFMPRSEQMGDMRTGSQCVVISMLDQESQRMIASARLYEHMPDMNNGLFAQDQQVQIMICQQTELGFKAVVDKTHLGMLYHNEVFSPLQIGDELTGYVKAPRADGKIDLVLQRQTREKLGEVESAIVAHLESNGGSSSLTDKSPPSEIYRTFGVSKKVYKQALGALYRARRITLSKEKIELV